MFLGSKGRWPAARRATILVDMTTSEPSLAREIYEAAKAKGVASVDAPVSGGDVGAKNAALSIMVGGDADVVEAVTPLFECMGKTIVHQGPAGAGQHTKMVNQILIATQHDRRVRGAALRLQGGPRPGDGASSRSAVGAAASKVAGTMLGPRIIARNFEPGFYVEHFIKDMGIALDEAEADGPVPAGPGAGEAALPGGAGPGLRPQGHARLMLALEQMSNVKM